MNIADFKPNSHRYKEEQKDAPGEKKKVEKVVTGSVKTKKKNRFASNIVSEDAKNVKSYLVLDVLIPALKNTIEDLVTNGIRMVLRGETGGRKPTTNASYVSYNKYSDRRDDHHTIDTRRNRIGYSYMDIVLEHRADADEVLSRLDEMIERYGVASVADLYDLVGETHNYTDNKYGWTNLATAKVVRTRDGGWLLDLPKAYPFD